jgi:hypothetical protein
MASSYRGNSIDLAENGAGCLGFVDILFSLFWLLCVFFCMQVLGGKRSVSFLV